MHFVSYVIATTKTIYGRQITKLLDSSHTTSNNIPVKNFKNRLLDFSCNKEKMEEKNKNEYDMPGFILSNPGNEYEMLEFSNNARRDDARPTEAALKKKSSKLSAWNRPLVVITILLCLIVFLLVVVLSLLLVLLSARDATCTSTSTAGAISGNTVSPNVTQWYDNIVNKLDHSLPDFDEWANGVVSKVNSNVTQSLPDFSEWANGVVSKVNQSLPDFNEWANGVVSKVNSNVTGSLPDFNEWANGVVSKVNMQCNREPS